MNEILKEKFKKSFKNCIESRKTLRESVNQLLENGIAREEIIAMADEFPDKDVTFCCLLEELEKAEVK